MNKKTENYEEITTYCFPSWLSKTMNLMFLVVMLSVVASLFIEGYRDWYFSDALTVFLFLIALLFLGKYFKNTKVIKTPSLIIKKGIFGNKKLHLMDVNKILIWGSRNNQSIGVVKIYSSSKKMFLDPLMINFDKLIRDLEFECKNAEIKYIDNSEIS